LDSVTESERQIQIIVVASEFVYMFVGACVFACQVLQQKQQASKQKWFKTIKQNKNQPNPKHSVV